MSAGTLGACGSASRPAGSPTRNVISSRERALSRLDSGAILGFINKKTVDPRFGAVWVTYDPYTVHLRLTDETATDLLGELESSLPSRNAVVVTVGGADAQALNAAVSTAQRLGIEFNMNVQDGYVDVYERAAQTDPAFDKAVIRLVPRPVTDGSIQQL